MDTTQQTPSLTNCDIRHAGEVDWIPWGSQGNARAKILGEASATWWPSSRPTPGTGPPRTSMPTPSSSISCRA